MLVCAVLAPAYAAYALIRAPGAARAGLRSVPAALWIMAGWAVLTCLFYIANHTYVQTRYVLVITPALTLLALYAIARAGGRRSLAAAAAFAAVAALAVSLLVARPFVTNKMVLVARVGEMTAFMRTKLAPDQPVAVYSIGQIAFESRHPIIDTGGITRTGVIPSMNSPDAVTAWAKREGAVYFIQDAPPEPGATLLFEIERPFAAWTLDLRQFAKPGRMRLWAASASAPQ